MRALTASLIIAALLATALLILVFRRQPVAVPAAVSPEAPTAASSSTSKLVPNDPTSEGAPATTRMVAASLSTSSSAAPEDPIPPAGGNSLFLPFERANRAEFEKKYAGWTADKLRLASTHMREAIDNRLDELTEQRIEKGLYDERANAMTPAQEGTAGSPQKFELMPAGTKPAGLGRVYPVSKYVQSGGNYTAMTSYLTEAEYPDLFANLDESDWVQHQLFHLEKKK